jgi:hypothetical protein
MDIDECVVTLQIATWAGITAGAIHYYGTLCGYVDGKYRKVDLECILTSKEAAELNAADRYDGWREGSRTGRFPSRERLIDTALRYYRDHFPQAIALAIGLFAASGPKHIVACIDSTLQRQANQLHDRAEAIGWWDDPNQYDQMDDLTKQWEELFEQGRQQEP